MTAAHAPLARRHRVAVLGATGAVGQAFIRMLADHPWFELTEVAASERSAGKTYREAAHWIGSGSMPANRTIAATLATAAAANDVPRMLTSRAFA